MLTVTEQAVTQIQNLTSQLPPSDDAGVRIAAAVHSGIVDLVVMVVDAPQPYDEVIHAAGARIYLDPEVTPLLEDQTLDAQPTERGNMRLDLRATPNP